MGTISTIRANGMGNNYVVIFWLGLLAVLFLFSVQLIGGGFEHMGSAVATTLLSATSNPFIGFFIGLLVTAILQSSSTTTTMAVALVASGSLPLTHAVPMVIGANVGTTLTSTLVSMSFIPRAGEFSRAFSAGIVHDLFNIIMALIVFPLEFNYQLLSRVSRWLAAMFPLPQRDFHLEKIVSVFDFVHQFLAAQLGPMATIALGFILLLVSVKGISRMLYKKWVIRSTNNDSVSGRRIKSFGIGVLVTSVIQSSSLSTSLMVPLVATGKVPINRAFAFIIGANLGTTVTALIAALFKSEVALSLAFVHFIFNLVGCLLFLAVPFLFSFVTYLSAELGSLALRKRAVGIAYIMLTFFILPFTLIFFSQSSVRGKQTITHQAEVCAQKQP